MKKGKQMDQFQAVGLAEGFISGTTQQKTRAWQYLHDTGLAYRLQGWFGRYCQSLLAAGIIKDNKKK